MKDDILNQLELIRSAWDGKTTGLQDDFTPYGYPGLTKQSISDSLGGMVTMANLLLEDKEFEPSLVTKAHLQATLNNLTTYVTQHVPSSPAPHIPGLLQQIEWARVVLRQWIDELDKRGRRAIPGLSAKLADAMSRMADADALYADIASWHEATQKFKEQSEENAQTIADVKAEIEETKSESATFAEEAANILSSAKIDADEIGSMVVEFKKLSESLRANKQELAALFEEFESYRDRVDDLLEDANRAGMAGSFVSRKVELEDALKLWRNVFAGTLVCLILMAVYIVGPSLSTDWKMALMRLPLSAPLVWLGWFAAKQYGYVVRLREDYAYKAASAMAFEGFKREAKEGEDGIQRKLLETAIKHFGDNPIRLYEKDSGNHGSPLHELLDKMLTKQGNEERLWDLIKKKLGV